MLKLRKAWCKKMNDITIKIIANYLPQYHRIPENDKWWGEGYTDWVATKNAKPLFEGHRQPRNPLKDNYYDLSNVETIRWQAELARKYGVYGFGIYHYWFNSDLQLLQKPAELLLLNKDIDINFMFIWDNSSWKRSWSNVAGNDWSPKYENNNRNYNKGNGILAKLEYGNREDWEKHFNCLLQFFKDDRYIKIDNKPLMGFFGTFYDRANFLKMLEFWDKLAAQYGFSGIACMNKKTGRFWTNLEYQFMYLPTDNVSFYDGVISRAKKCIGLKIKDKIYSYDILWEKTLKNAISSGRNTFLSGVVQYDDTPRRGENAMIYKGSTPQKFQKYFTELLKISKQQGKEYVFCPAWNEWGEGMYLEPDTVDGYAYLEALKAAVDEVNGK
ncbi:MAG: glycoside hydrolase family 99-like domain-containing protein [Phascolarctobacterium sp.]|nr:glycoside hydrolase family 99-like domain-containing protein [Phascolarctobacterium sp.]